MPHIHDKYDFTVSMFVIHPSDPKFCVHWHEKLQVWNCFGGHIELDQDPLEALEAEMSEETGLSPDDYDILQTYDAPLGVGDKELPNPFAVNLWKYGDIDHYHIDMPYVLRAKTDVIKPLENESQQIKWITLDKAEHMHNTGEIDDSVIRILRWLANRYF